MLQNIHTSNSIQFSVYMQRKMGALKWSLLALTALLCSAICSAHRATPIAGEPAPFRSGPTPGIPHTPQKPISAARLAPPRPPPEFDGPIPAPAFPPSPAFPLSSERSTPAAGPPPSPTRPPSTTSGPTPAPATGPVPAPAPSAAEMNPAPFPSMKNHTDESNIAVNCCGAGWGSPGCGGMSCPGGGAVGCGGGPCPPVPKNPYYCQPAGCGGNPGYGCGSGGGFTIYMGDHFPSAASGDENKS